MGLHVDSQADELHPFSAQTHSLFKAAFAGKKNLAIRANNAMPRQSAGGVQCPRNLARRTRISGGVRDVAVSGNFAARNATHLREQIRKHGARHWNERSEDRMIGRIISSQQSAVSS